MNNKNIIPRGPYCYTMTGQGKKGRIKSKVCPYWSRRDDKPEQENGYCSFLKVGDWELPGSHLWDQIKECGVKDD